MSQVNLGNDQDFFYLRHPGKAGRPFLVFLHEGLGSVAQWRDFPEQLCRRTGCPGLVYDRIGHGLSSPLSRPRTLHYLHGHALSELPRVLAKLIPDHPYLLIGHSDGGSIALIAGSERPPLLKAIIGMAAHVFVEPCSLEGIEQARADYAEGKLRAALMRYHGEKTDRLFAAWADTWTSPWFRFWNIEYLLPAIETPVLVLQGREDQYGTMAQVDAIVRRSAGPATPLLLEDCGHAPHLECPDLCLDLMTCFINRHART
ncbi:alpha/beta fold hydrolase [Desulfobulbus propionicus]|jgi:pimeloyl-ACP methyl ester carboxylesterase